MFSMVMDSTKLFFTGRLFKDYGKMFQLFCVGAGVGTAATVLIGMLVSPVAGAIVGGAVAGLAQPLLFKNLKYR